MVRSSQKNLPAVDSLAFAKRIQLYERLKDSGTKICPRQHGRDVESGSSEY